MMSDIDVTFGESDSAQDFFVRFEGPKDSPYEGGIWKVHVVLPDNYPYKSPSIGFCNAMFHPNVDERSGSICLDVINQTWSPMFDLVNIFKVFLPQLLLYPNPADPLNGDAAALLMQDREAYARKVRDYVKRHASDDVNIHAKPAGADGDADGDGEDPDDDDMSDLDDDPAADLEL